MTIEERIEKYRYLFRSCKAIKPVGDILRKGFNDSIGITQRMELLRELDTELAEAYNVRIPVLTFFVRDNSYVFQTKEIFLGEPDLEAFLHQFRHHLQNEAREQSRKLLLVEDDPKKDYRLPYKDTVLVMSGEDDAIAWSRMILDKFVMNRSDNHSPITLALEEYERLE